MTTEIAFKKADLILGKAIQIWESRTLDKYNQAEIYYQQALAIRDEYFPDNKNVLTEDLCPF
jgi:hypothetical protein